LNLARTRSGDIDDFDATDERRYSRRRRPSIKNDTDDG